MGEGQKQKGVGGRTRSCSWPGSPGSLPSTLTPPLCVPQNLRPFSTLDLTSPMLGVASEHTRQLLLEGPVRVKEGREGKVRVLRTEWRGRGMVGEGKRQKRQKWEKRGFGERMWFWLSPSHLCDPEPATFPACKSRDGTKVTALATPTFGLCVCPCVSEHHACASSWTSPAPDSS